MKVYRYEPSVFQGIPFLVIAETAGQAAELVNRSNKTCASSVQAQDMNRVSGLWATGKPRIKWFD